MATRTTSIMALVTQIQNGELVLPDFQRDFVWKEDQIRLLFDSIMRGYPFGSLLFWNTQYVDVPYRDFVHDIRTGQTFATKIKDAGKRLTMVLDGQQRLQSLFVAVVGTYDGRRLYFNMTSGPDGTVESEDGTGRNFRFEFWRDDQPNRGKRVIRVADVAGWSPRHEQQEIERAIAAAELSAEEAPIARSNLLVLRQVLMVQLVPLETIDEDVLRPEQARTIDEILEIFVRMNDGGTRLTKSDLMFSLIKTKWTGARDAFDTVLEHANRSQELGIDKDFVIKGLLTVADKPPTIEVQTIARHWPDMERRFDDYEKALRATIDFCRDPDVGIEAASLLAPIATLHPLVYYVARQPGCSIPDAQRGALKTFLYFLLFNEFVISDARIRWLREVVANPPQGALRLDALLDVVKKRQRETATETSTQMLGWNPQLTLNIVQRGVARETLSWQARAEVAARLRAAAALP